MKTVIALAAALTIGAASTALADYEYDASGAPINMHIVDAQQGAFASADVPVVQARPGSFTAQERALFDRTSRPYNVGEESIAR